MEMKLMGMEQAISRFVHDGDVIVIEGFTHLICFAAAHEIIRQRRRELILCRLTPDLIYDQLIGAGCARKLVFSWAGNPGAGPLYALRRAVENGIPNPLELEEYSHYGMVARLTAGAAKLPFYPLRNYMGSDLPRVNQQIKKVACPFTGEELAAVPALNPDTAIIHAQRADENGNARDNDFYIRWREISKDVAQFNSYLDEWIYGVRDRAEYVERMGASLAGLKAHDHFCEPVNYGY